MRDDFDIVGSYDNQRYPSINAERTINMFEYMDSEGKRPKTLIFTSGIADSGETFSISGGFRAQFVFKDAIYSVVGDSVFRTTGTIGNLTTILLGTLTTSSGYVGIDANTFQVIFVDGEKGYIWDTNASTFEAITDSNFPIKPIDVTQLDGFFVVAAGDTNNFYLSSFEQGMVWGTKSTVWTVDNATEIITLTSNSNANFRTGVPVTLSVSGGGVLPTVTGTALNTSTTYYTIAISAATVNPGTIKLARSYADAIAGTAIDFTNNGVATLNMAVVGQLQVGAINSHPGTIVACRTLHRRLFLFSQNFTEVWENAGIGTNLPFRRNNSLLMEVGTPAIGSIATGFDRMFFLAQTKDGLDSVMEVKGSQAIPVSNRALDSQLADFAGDPDTGVSDARGILIKENGLIFYRLNFTLANHTFVLGVSMSTTDSVKWHEEEVLNGDRHPAQTHAYFAGTNFYGDYESPIMYIVDKAIMTNNNEAIRRARISRQFTPKGYNRLRIDRFLLDVIQGQTDMAVNVSGNLLQENGFDILTETGLILLLEQSLSVISQSPQPTIFLSLSKDGGQTYGTIFEAKMGKLAERTFRSVWRKLGTTRRGQGIVVKIEFYNQVPFVILGAGWVYDVLPE